LLGGKPSRGGQIRTDRRSAAIHLVAVEALRLPFKNGAAGFRIACNRLHRGVWSCQAADVGDHLPDLFGAELCEIRHCRASDAGTDGLEDFAVGIAVFQRTAGERGCPLASTRPASMAALAGALVYPAASLDGTRAAGERIFLSLRNILLCQEEAKTGHAPGEQPHETVSEGWKNLHSQLSPRLGVAVSADALFQIAGTSW